MTKYRVLSVFSSFVFCLLLGSCKEGSIETLTGKIRIIGNEPHTTIVLEVQQAKPENGVLYLTGNLAEQLRPYQNTIVTVKGMIGKRLPGNGYEFKILEIIEVPDAVLVPDTKPLN